MPKDFTSPSKDVFIDVKRVAEILGVSVATVHRLRSDDDFPKARAISERCVRWRKSEIEDWLNSRILCFTTHYAA